MATPFTGTLVIRYKDGTVDPVNVVFSDVNAAAVTFGDTLATDYVLSGAHGCAWITDLSIGAAASVSTSDLYINNKAVGCKIVHASNLNTGYSRQFQNAPFGAISPAAKINITQRT